MTDTRVGSGGLAFACPAGKHALVLGVWFA